MNKSKIINLVFAVVFLVFAVIQLNDPDAVQWFLLYFLVSVLFVVANYKSIPKKFTLVLIIAYVAYSGWYFSYFMDWIDVEDKEEIFGAMVYEKPYLEGTREFLGLLIAAGGLLYLYSKSPKTKT